MSVAFVEDLYGYNTPLRQMYDDILEYGSDHRLVIGEACIKVHKYHIPLKNIVTICRYLASKSFPDRYKDMIDVYRSVDIDEESSNIDNFIEKLRMIVDEIPECAFLMNDHMIVGSNWNFVILCCMTHCGINFMIPLVSCNLLTKFIGYACEQFDIPFDEDVEHTYKHRMDSVCRFYY